MPQKTHQYFFASSQTSSRRLLLAKWASQRLPATSSNSKYVFTHTAAVNGNNIYRLEMLELDESYPVSPVVKVALDCKKGNGFVAKNVMANTTVGQIFMTGLVKDTDNSIQILNLQGHEISNISEE